LSTKYVEVTKFVEEIYAELVHEIIDVKDLPQGDLEKNETCRLFYGLYVKIVII
jgi:hypothetical protein